MRLPFKLNSESIINVEINWEHLQRAGVESTYMLCACVCRRARHKKSLYVYILLTWNQSCGGVIMILAPFPEGSSLTAPGRDCKLAHSCLERLSSLSQTYGWHEQKLKRWRGFVFLTVTWAGELSPSLPGRRSYCHVRKAGLSHKWMDSLHGSRPLKSVWVMSCQHRGEQQQIELLKQFSSTGGLLSACQQPDYSIQLFCCLQSAQSFQD